MKKIFFIVFILIPLMVLITSCAPEIKVKEFKTFTDDKFSVNYPGWNETSRENVSNETVFFASGSGCNFVVNKYPAYEDILYDLMIRYLRENKINIIFNNSENKTFEVLTKQNSYETKLITKIIQCIDYAYTVNVGCEIHIYDKNKKLIDEIINSGKCTALPREKRTTGKIGIIINPKNDNYEYKNFREVINNISGLKVDIVHNYFSWGQIENSRGNYNWSVPDYLINNFYYSGFENSAVIETIHTSVLGEYPKDVKFFRFNDGVLKKRLAEFINNFLDRYNTNGNVKVKYIEIGNEVNIYFKNSSVFGNHTQELGDYLELFDYVYTEVKKKHPEVQISIITAYHEAKNENDYRIIEKINQKTDFAAYTFYLYNDGFKFNTNAYAFEEYVNGMINHAQGKKIAITETGWNTDPVLNSSEQQQMAYIRQFFKVVKSYRENIEFATYFVLHDSSLDTCDKAAESFYPADKLTEIKKMPYYGIFVRFLCSFGLKNYDGTPKSGWYEFVNQTENY